MTVLNIDMDKAIWRNGDEHIYPTEVIAKLKASGLKEGDILMGHFDLKAFGKIGDIKNKFDFYNTIINILISIVGPEGGVIIPTYSYSFCKDEVFDQLHTPSTVGSMAEVALKRLQDNHENYLGEAIYRSNDPLFSCVGFGKAAESICSNIGLESFGKDSIYEHLYKAKAKLMGFGFMFAVTYMHYVEHAYHLTKRKLPYRYDKEFSGTFINLDGSTKKITCNYFVRNLEFCEYDFPVIPQELKRLGRLNTAYIGAGEVTIATAEDLYNTMFEMLDRDILCLLNAESRSALEKHLAQTSEKKGS